MIAKLEIGGLEFPFEQSRSIWSISSERTWKIQDASQ